MSGVELQTIALRLPGLTDLSLHRIFFRSGSSDETTPLSVAPIHAPTLRSFSVTAVTTYNNTNRQLGTPLQTIENVVSALSAPELVSLTVGFQEEMKSAEMYRIMENSAGWDARFPNLKILRFKNAIGPKEAFLRILTPVPQVRHLEFCFTPELDSRMEGSFIEFIADPDPETEAVFARLESLTIQGISLPVLHSIMCRRTIKPSPRIRLHASVYKNFGATLRRMRQMASFETVFD